MSETDLYPGFAPPAAALTSSDTETATVPFFLVGTRKLVVMTIVTFGGYELYWFYMHWRRLQEVGQEDVWPIVRAIFGGLFCYWLFARVNDEADAQGTPTLLSPALLTILYFAGVLAVRPEVPLWLGLGLTALPLALMQSIVNRLPQVTSLPKVARNERLSKKNWAGVAVFALVTLLMLLPEPDVTTGSANDVPLEALVASTNKDLPRTMTGGVVLQRVETVAGRVRLYVLLENVKDGTEGEVDVVASVRKSLLESACTSDHLERTVLERGLSLRYLLAGNTRKRIATMEVMTPAQCAALAQ